MKLKLISIVVPALALFSLTVQAADISAEKEMYIKFAINDLVNEYAVARDAGDAVAYANTFSEDGVLDLYGTEYGREALIERVNTANPNSVGMHHMTSGQITVIDETNATGVQYMTLYTGTRGEDQEEGAPVSISNFTVMGKYLDTYVLTDDGWKFARRAVEPVFRPEQ